MAAASNVTSTRERSTPEEPESKIVPLHVALSAIEEVGSLYERQKAELLDFYQRHPTLVGGDYIKGEIEIVTDPDAISKVENFVEQILLDKGRSPAAARERSRAGVISKDEYFILIRDAVYFSNGMPGIYNRLFERSSLEKAGQGAIALPITEEGKILFNLTYRHATRNWGMEVARGFSDKADGSLSNTCTRELAEETGMQSQAPISLGTVCANTGISGTLPEVFLCPLTGSGKPNRGNEAIKKCIPFSLQEVSNAIVNGYFEYDGKRIPFIDGFSMNAIVKAHTAGYINLPTGIRNDSPDASVA